MQNESCKEGASPCRLIVTLALGARRQVLIGGDCYLRWIHLEDLLVLALGSFCSLLHHSGVLFPSEDYHCLFFQLPSSLHKQGYVSQRGFGKAKGSIGSFKVSCNFVELCETEIKIKAHARRLYLEYEVCQ